MYLEAARRIFLNTSVTTPIPISSFLQTLRRHVRSSRPVHTSNHCSGPVLVSGDLLTEFHIYLRIDRIRKSLEPSYAGSYKVLSRTFKVFTVEVDGKPVTVLIDMLKAAHVVPEEVAFRISSPIPTCSAQKSDVVTRYRRCSRKVIHFQA
ncbi:hypothetical protein AVEN_81353-1 [Araneus ventricosus]|uniref:Uncharacterized protein n=1 Tax=Araneus ventricosus TaxID=182803 RepID=A0A4Y2B9J4_ARAVE|nr:hypothetical protein AVEN_81353-1 [Araneus ventricosus]